MRRVAQQCHAPVDPVQHRVAVAEHPFLPVLAAFDDLLRLGVDVFETLSHLGMVDGLARDGGRGVVVIGHDQVEALAIGQGVMHDMAFRPGPERRVVPAQVLGHGVAGDHAAIGGVAGHPGGAVAQHLRAHPGPQAVSADQRAAPHPFAALEDRGDAGVVLLVPRDGRGGAQADQRVFAAGAQKDAVQFAPVHHGIGVAKARAEIGAQRDARDLARAQRVHQAQVVDIDRHLARLRPHAQRVEGVKGVGAQLDARADLAQFGGLFEDEAGDARLRKAHGSGKAPDAAPGDEDRVAHSKSGCLEGWAAAKAGMSAQAAAMALRRGRALVSTLNRWAENICGIR